MTITISTNVKPLLFFISDPSPEIMSISSRLDVSSLMSGLYVFYGFILSTQDVQNLLDFVTFLSHFVSISCRKCVQKTEIVHIAQRETKFRAFHLYNHL